MFGRTADIKWTSSTPQREVHVVDWLPAWELVKQGVSLHGLLTIYRLHKDGGIEAAGMQATWADLVREKYFSIMVLDRYTDTVIFQANRCSVHSQDWRAARGYVMGTIGFQALDWNNETSASTE
jgi:hypothetical protein